MRENLLSQIPPKSTDIRLQTICIKIKVGCQRLQLLAGPSYSKRYFKSHHGCRMFIDR